MALKIVFNPFTNNFDFVDDTGSVSSDNVLIKRAITQDFTIPSGYTMLGRDTVIDSGITLTIDTDGELLEL